MINCLCGGNYIFIVCFLLMIILDGWDGSYMKSYIIKFLENNFKIFFSDVGRSKELFFKCNIE